MKKIIAVISVTLILLLTASCAGDPLSTDYVSAKNSSSHGADETAASFGEGLNIVTTIFPPYDFVREVAGDRPVNLSMLLPPGSESHSYEPTPKDIITIQDCDIFIYNGGASDSWVDGILDSMSTDGIIILSMMNLVDVVEEKVVEGMEGGHDDAEEDHSNEETEFDEHVWTSPSNAKKIVAGICAAMMALDTENAAVFEENTEKYLNKLSDLDAKFTEIAYSGKRNTIIFGDRFPLRYFADAYDLEYFAAFPGCSTETEPSASTVAFLIDKIKEEDIPVVFHIEFSNEKMADTISEATGAKKLLFHSCHNVSKADIEAGTSYLQLMEQNSKNLEETLN